MTVVDNLMLGRHRHMRAGVLAGALFWGRSRREETVHRRRVEEVIEFLELERHRKERIANLPFEEIYIQPASGGAASTGGLRHRERFAAERADQSAAAADERFNDGFWHSRFRGHGAAFFNVE